MEIWRWIAMAVRGVICKKHTFSMFNDGSEYCLDFRRRSRRVNPQIQHEPLAFFQNGVDLVRLARAKAGR
jgi:hypothetical protein